MSLWLHFVHFIAVSDVGNGACPSAAVENVVILGMENETSDRQRMSGADVLCQTVLPSDCQESANSNSLSSTNRGTCCITNAMCARPF